MNNRKAGAEKLRLFLRRLKKNKKIAKNALQRSLFCIKQIQQEHTNPKRYTMITAIDCNLLRKLISVPGTINLMWIRPCDGEPIRKSLLQLANEINKLNPHALVSVESRKEGHIWDGVARHMDADLDGRYLRMTSAMEVITDFSGIVIIVR